MVGVWEVKPKPGIERGASREKGAIRARNDKWKWDSRRKGIRRRDLLKMEVQASLSQSLWYDDIDVHFDAG